MMGQAIRRRVEIFSLAVRLYRTFKRIQRLQGEKSQTSRLGASNRMTEKGSLPSELSTLYAAAGRDIRETASRLCGAIVKAGQFLSLREELFPDVFTRQLEGLQDEVQAAPFTAVRKTIEHAYGKPVEAVFQSIEPEPIASGSLAEVHQAWLKDGQMIALKILRPGIERLVDIDLKTLGRVARIFGRVPALHKHIDLVALHREFENTLTLELDMQSEAQHMERLRKTFKGNRGIIIPDVYWELTTPNILAMTYLTGANIKDENQLREWQVDREAVRDTLLSAYLQQLMVTGFVHLDPHPGNLVVQSDGRLALLDFGMVAEYSEEELASFRSLAQRVFLHDLEGAVRALQGLGFIQKDANPAAFLRETGLLTEKQGGPATDTDFQMNVADVLRRLIGHQGFRVQARYMLLIRCIGMLKTALMMLTPKEEDWTSVLASQALPVLSRLPSQDSEATM